MRKQWKEIRSYTESLEMPFFYVVGNHDISRTRPGFPKANNIATDVWEENFGKNTTYYSFIYKNVLFICLNLQEGLDDRKPQVIFTEPQYQWTVETLKKHPDVRWTMIFVHSPYHWDYPNFIRLEKFLKEKIENIQFSPGIGINISNSDVITATITHWEQPEELLTPEKCVVQSMVRWTMLCG